MRQAILPKIPQCVAASSQDVAARVDNVVFRIHRLSTRRAIYICSLWLVDGELMFSSEIPRHEG